jgi:hypothetical protein
VEKNETLAGYPYLSDTFQFTEREIGSSPYLRNIHCYTYAAMPSLASSAGISALKFGVVRIVSGITRDLFTADAETHLASLRAYREKELVRSTLPFENEKSTKVA